MGVGGGIGHSLTFLEKRVRMIYVMIWYCCIRYWCKVHGFKGYLVITVRYYWGFSDIALGMKLWH